jgi:hypothetical protein
MSAKVLQVDSPPYAIANNNVRLPLSFRTVPATARHRDGTLHYNTHNVYGLTHAAATARALDALYKGQKRSFVLTRCAPLPRTRPRTPICRLCYGEDTTEEFSPRFNH